MKHFQTSLIDSMYFDSEGKVNWEVLADTFFLNIANKKRVQSFVKTVHAAKIETERKMRVELDRKVVNMRIEKLASSIGKDFAERIRYYVKKYREHVQASANALILHKNASAAQQLSPPCSQSPKRQKKVASVSPLRSPAKKGRVYFKEPDFIESETKEELVKKMVMLQESVKDVEHGLPLLSYKTDDEMS